MSEIKKAQVTLPPPGVSSRWAVIGGNTNTMDIPYPDKRQQCSVYYEMYRQHPVVRSAIDKKAQYAVASGWRYVPSNHSLDIDTSKQEALQEFFRQSSGLQLLRMTFKDLDIYGEAFWLVIRNMNGTPMKAVRLNPRFTVPVLQDGILIAWKYGPAPNAMNANTYPEELVLHFRLEDPESDVQGLSPLHPLQRTVAQDIFAMEYNESFFTNSAQTGTIFIVKTSTEDEAARNRQWLEENYTGPQNAHRPLLLEGDVEVEKSVSSAQDMEFLEGRMFLRQEIAMALEVDLDKLGIHEGSNRSVSKEVNQAFYSESVWPRQVLVEEEINNRLINSIFGWNDILFDFEDKDPRRSQDQADVDDKNLKAGRESINEQRVRMGLLPIPGGDVYAVMTPTGLLFVENFEALAASQASSSLPVVTETGLGSSGVVPPKSSMPKEPLTRLQAEAVSQHEPT